MTLVFSEASFIELYTTPSIFMIEWCDYDFLCFAAYDSLALCSSDNTLPFYPSLICFAWLSDFLTPLVELLIFYLVSSVWWYPKLLPATGRIL
mgnify:FL=1